jgi:membrane protease YdiL (CAAX protease family)
MQATTPGSADARRTVVGMSVVFAVVLAAGAWLLLLLTHRSPAMVFSASSLGERVLIGIATGALVASACALVVQWLPSLARVRRLAQHAVEGIEPRWHTMLAVSLAAGFSEELFFRGALQAVAGRWLTAAGFVALHGALRIRDRGALVFAVFLFAASLGLSALCAWKGLECAMAAHAAYDLTMLLWLLRGARAG